MVLLLVALLALARALAMTDDELVTNITKTLDSHLLEGSKWGMNYHFYRPGLVKYGPDQWLWDSCFRRKESQSVRYPGRKSLSSGIKKACNCKRF